jgi:hypothetical protein
MALERMLARKSWPGAGRPDRAARIAERTRIVVDHEDAGSLETGHIDVTVRAPIAWFTVDKDRL